MAKFFEELKRIRRFLRDPDGNIWSDDLLIGLWNEMQRRLQVERNLLIDVAVLGAPPKIHATYLYQWEYGYSGVSRPIQQVLRDQGGFYVASGRFEHQAAQGFSIDVASEHENYTQPFEAWLAGSAGLVEWPLPRDFFRARAIYYDEWPLFWRAPRDIQRQDPSWPIRSGTPQWYTRSDMTHNTITPFPRPETIAWNDEITGSDTEWAVSASWELDEVTDSAQFTDESTTQSWVFTWEESVSADTDIARGMWLFEAAFSPGGVVVAIVGDTIDRGETGVISFREGSLLSAEVGAAVAVLETEDNLAVIYDVMPLDVESVGDDLIWPDWMLKYIRFGVLGRAFKANTDGRIPSLAAYWDRRYEIGKRALDAFRSANKEDRDYQLRTKGVRTRLVRRHPRLPDTYPAIYP